MSADGQVAGCYVHGLFDHPEAADSLLAWAGLTEPEAVDYDRHRQAELDRLADQVDTHLDTAWLATVLR